MPNQTQKSNNIIRVLPPSVQMKLEPLPKLSDFEEKEHLGKGSFGRVFRAIHKSSGEEYAIKEVEKKRSDKENCNREIEIMYKLNHINIVKLFSHFESDDYLYFVMEFCSGGNLYSLRKQQRNSKFADKKAAYYIASLVNAISHLHIQDPPIIHRDIKLENLLLTNSNSTNTNTSFTNVSIVKLTDFGWSAFLLPQEARSTFCGTKAYMPPEILSNLSQDQSVDIWCIGVLLFEMTTGKLPFTGDDFTIRNNILSGKIEFTTDMNMNFQLKDLITKILKVDPNKRLSLKEIKDHPYITDNLKQLSQTEIEIINGKITNKIENDNKEKLFDFSYVMNKKLLNEKFDHCPNTHTHNHIHNIVSTNNSINVLDSTNDSDFKNSFNTARNNKLHTNSSFTYNNDNNKIINITTRPINIASSNNQITEVDNPILNINNQLNYSSNSNVKNYQVFKAHSNISKQNPHNNVNTAEVNLITSKDNNNSGKLEKYANIEELKKKLNQALEENNKLKKEIKMNTIRYNDELAKINEELKNKYDEVVDLNAQNEKLNSELEEIKINLQTKESNCAKYEEEIKEKNAIIRNFEDTKFRKSNNNVYYEDEIIKTLKDDKQNLIEMLNSLEEEHHNNLVKYLILKENHDYFVEESRSIEDNVSKRYHVLLDNYEKSLRNKEWENYELENKITILEQEKELCIALNKTKS